MNLTNTKRWQEFKDWYDNNFHTIPIQASNIIDFVHLPFEFQEGVYRKFIESLNLNVKIDKQYDYSFILKFDNQILKSFNTFQELVEWFFNS